MKRYTQGVVMLSWRTQQVLSRANSMNSEFRFEFCGCIAEMIHREALFETIESAIDLMHKRFQVLGIGCAYCAGVR
jgi:hypothetical protein